jgi:hypothetical protein
MPGVAVPTNPELAIRIARLLRALRYRRWLSPARWRHRYNMFDMRRRLRQTLGL